MTDEDVASVLLNMLVVDESFLLNMLVVDESVLLNIFGVEASLLLNILVVGEGCGCIVLLCDNTGDGGPSLVSCCPLLLVGDVRPVTILLLEVGGDGNGGTVIKLLSPGEASGFPTLLPELACLLLALLLTCRISGVGGRLSCVANLARSWELGLSGI